MARKFVVCFALLLGATLNDQAAAQNAGDMINMFTSIMRGAIVNNARVEWSRLPPNGTVKWEGRTLDAIVVKSLIKQKNAILGKYDASCFTFGLVDDPEFGMSRGPFAVDCGNTGFVNSWETNKGFNSEWNVSP
jgi:hypothetical protein